MTKVRGNGSTYLRWQGTFVCLIIPFLLNLSPAETAVGENGSNDMPLPIDVGSIQLTFPDNVKLKTVVDYVAKRLGKNIIYEDSLVSRTITLRSPVPVSKDELMALLRSTLRFHGLMLVDSEQAGWLKIVADNKMGQSVAQNLLSSQVPSGVNVVVTRLIELKHISAGRFSGLISFLLIERGGNVVVLPGDRTLIVTDYITTVEAIVYLQKYLDIPRLQQRWSIYRLSGTTTDRISDDLKNLIEKTLTDFEPRDQKKDISMLHSAIPIKQLNAFLLTGTGEQIAHMESMLKTLDVSRPLSTRIYSLENISAQRASMMLRQMILPIQNQDGVTDEWVITVDAEANILLVTCPQLYCSKVQEWIENEIDIPTEVITEGLSTRVFKVKYARAVEVAATLQNVFSISETGGSIKLELENSKSLDSTLPEDGEKSSKGDVSGFSRKGSGKIGGFNKGGKAATFNMTVYEPTNSIIVTAPRQILPQIERLIVRLDHHRPQVLVDVTIISVNKTETFDMGVELQKIAISRDGSEQKLLSSSFGLLDVDPVTWATGATLGVGFNAVLLRPGEMAAILRMAHSRLDGRVIARPQLLIDDNAVGYLNSITEQPYTSINSGQTVSTTSFGGYAEAGTQLTLTPHISEGDVVHLEYEILSSSFTGSSSSGNIPPPRATDSIRSQVTIPSGCVLLVGGLTRENQQKSQTAIPLLGDIPLLGELFKVRSSSRSETVLYVFLRPIIIRQDRFAYLKFVSRQALNRANVKSDVPEMEMEFLQ